MRLLWRHASLTYLCCIFLIIAIVSNIQQSTTLFDNARDKRERVSGKRSSPTIIEFDNHSSNEQKHRGEEVRHLTTNAHTNTIQFLVLSPTEPHHVVGIGTTAFVPCPLPKYTKEDGSLELHAGGKVYTTTSVQHEELQGGPLVLAYFGIGIEERIQWMTSAPPESFVVVDKVLNTSHRLPLQMDPNARNEPHFLSATTTVRKQYRQYNGLGKHVQNGTKADSWSDEEVLYRLSHWVDFHRKAGVDHFYIVDNDSDPTKPNIPLIGSDVTYFRAAHIPYDGWRCYSDEHTSGKEYLTVFGQLLLENTMVRLAHTQWLLVGDLDEFFVADDRYESKLSNLIRSYQNVSCQGEKPIACTPLLDTTFQNVFSFNFLPQIISINNTRLFEVVYRYKPILRPDLTSTISVHYSRPFNDSQSTMTTIPPRHGFLAHYNKRGGLSGHNWTFLLSNVHHHSQDLRET